MQTDNCLQNDSPWMVDCLVQLYFPSDSLVIITPKPICTSTLSQLGDFGSEYLLWLSDAICQYVVMPILI
jgi:hypothetical protein